MSFEIGDRVKLMPDQKYAQKKGDLGTITGTTDHGVMLVTWDKGNQSFEFISYLEHLSPLEKLL